MKRCFPSLISLRNIRSSHSKSTKTTNTIMGTPIVAIEEVNRFIVECLEASGALISHAEAMADLLVEADKRGHFSHGLNRLEMYVHDLKSGTTDGAAVPQVLNESEASAWVDGNNGLGAVVGNFCMDLAIEKARKTGIGFVVAKGSNHYGLASWYPKRALLQNMIGFSGTNTSPFMCPTRAKTPVLGTNPLSLCAPGTSKDDSFVLDMATTTVAVGKIEIQKRKGEPIPTGWAMDKHGGDTTDPNSAKLLYPMGGDELHSGFKGYGLGLMVEVLCGILAGGAYGHRVRRWGQSNICADLGQFFMAIDPCFFAPGFNGRMSDMVDYLRNLTPVEEDKPVLVAGDPERAHEKETLKLGGIRYTKNQMETCQKLSENLGVCMLRTTN